MNELERLKRIEAAARALVDAINADGDVDITPQANALAEALEANQHGRDEGGFVSISSSAGGLTVVARGGRGSAGHASKEAKP